MSDDESPMPRKIEEQMLDAIRKEKDFSLRNTRVEVIDFPGVSKRINVYLYSKCICKLTEDELEVNHHGFMTLTTKSRINALLREFNGCTEIIQVQGKWYWQTLSKVVGVKHQWRSIPSYAQAFTFPRRVPEHQLSQVLHING